MESRATARAAFLHGISHEDAWRRFSNMFQVGKHPLPGKGSLSAINQAVGGKSLMVGDEFSVSTHADKYRIRITACSMPSLLSYQVFAESDGSGKPCETVEIRIQDKNGHLFLEVLQILSRQKGGLHSLANGLISVLSRKRAAVRSLETLLEVDGITTESSWVGDWKGLPIDHESVEVKT